MKQFESDINKLKAAIIGCEIKLGMGHLSEISIDELSHRDMIVYYNGLLDEIDAIAWE